VEINKRITQTIQKKQFLVLKYTFVHEILIYMLIILHNISHVIV